MKNQGEKENKKPVYTCIGASNHAKGSRQNEDYYATEPKAIDILLTEGGHMFDCNILECACGEGHLSERLKAYGYHVTSMDLIDRGYGSVKNFFDILKWEGDILTNPPYKCAREFVEHALEIIPEGNQVAMFLKLTFLESKSRKALFERYPTQIVYMSSSRLLCAKNGDFERQCNKAIAYGWYIWVKGRRGQTIIKWIN